MARDVTLTLFDSGTLTSRGVTVPVPFYVLEHPHGNVIVDGGNPLAVALDAEAHWGPLVEHFEVHMTPEQHCIAQLHAHGIDPESIRYVLQTHLHIDHTGALGHFPNATVVVHERELEAARASEAPIGNGYVQADFDRPELEWQTLDHGQGEDGFDLFGDGTLRAILTPGHSAGHMSLLVTLPETGVVLLTADASDTRRQFDGLDHPRALFSRDAANASVARLRVLAERTGALVVPGHDPDAWGQLRRAPDAYA